jgi:hypothetical protein
LNALNLLKLSVRVEEKIGDAFYTEISLADESVISEESSPYRTVQEKTTLMSFQGLLDEEGNLAFADLGSFSLCRILQELSSSKPKLLIQADGSFCRWLYYRTG